MFQIKVVEKIKTHILYSTTFSADLTVYVIISKNVVEPERAQVAIQRRVARWVSKATRGQAHARAGARTHKYIILISFRRQQWFRERASILRYT
jgi:hypothetical protein